MRYIVLDTETTGLKEPEVCEVAWIEIDTEFNELSEFDSLIKPPKPIGCDAAGVHGIRNYRVEGEPTIDEIDFPEGEICLIGHNIKFDRPLVEPYMDIVAQCDTLILARRLLQDAPDHKLQTLACYLDLPETISHRAISDVKTCIGLFEFLCGEVDSNMIGLINWSNQPQPVEVMPWGKHQGTPIREVPKSYIAWLSGLADLDLDLHYTVQMIMRGQM